MSENDADETPQFQLRAELIVTGKLTGNQVSLLRELVKRWQPGDTYNVHAATGMVGPVRATNLVVQQIIDEADIGHVADELARVIDFMSQAAATPNAEYRAELRQLEEAQMAARNGDRSKLFSHLKEAGIRTLRVAQDVGADLIARLLEHWLEFPQ